LITSVNWGREMFSHRCRRDIKATKRRACLLLVDCTRSDDQGFSVIKPRYAELHDSKCWSKLSTVVTKL